MRFITQGDTKVKTTDHPLISMTEQELFNKAYYGVYLQNEPEYIDDAYRSDDSDYCLDEAYLDNSPDNAITVICWGHKTPSEWLSPEVDNFWNTIGIDPETVSPERKTFLTLLRLTDHADREDGPMEPLNQFAREHGLQVPSDLD
jgi:hypothetical protein